MANRKVREKKLTPAKSSGMEQILDLIAALPPDMFLKKRIDPKPQRRKGLLQMFGPKTKNRCLTALRKKKKSI
jgi:hypothetical protein